MSLAHLDRPFDYLVPARFADDCVPGCRVRVRFAGALADGYVLERVERSEHEGRLAFLDRVVSAEPVLSPEVAAVARAVADRYAGSLADVLRLAVPPRHAKVEAEPPAGAARPEEVGESPAAESWRRYVAGAAFLRGLAEGRAVRAVWDALPGEDWPAAIAAAAVSTAGGGRGVLVVVPDHRDLDRVDAAMVATLGTGRHVVLTAELGPAERYRRWLAVRRGTVRVAVGTRAAMFAPVHDLGLVVCWDDGDDLHAEPRAPYPHVREVLCTRAHLQGASALIGGFARTAEATLLVRTGWAQVVAGARAEVRERMPAVRAAGDDAELARDPGARSARLPHLAWRTAHEALEHGPVLVQTPRRGYVPALACARCRTGARCPHCAGPLAADREGGRPACRWCGRPVTRWACGSCGGTGLRAVVVGAARTAEELGRAFPGVTVRVSGGDSGVLAEVSATPQLVVATPGAEPVAAQGYAAALLLDGWALLGRADLRAGEETLRRWANACALVRSGGSGGRVVVLAESTLRPVQSLMRWDTAGFADRELAEREEMRFPPAVRAAVVSGDPSAVDELLRIEGMPAVVDVLGPVPVPARDGADHVRAVVRVPRAEGAALARALHAGLAVRSAAKKPGTARVQVDPQELL
ncbi:MAG: primosome assembly protein PriA [Streptosporangiales bacterium]|nr:primosome assembly protein PriA [Streptosporangiales bacterium]